LIDANQPTLDAMPQFALSKVSEVKGRSLLLFTVRPEQGTKAGAAAERSFAHVIEALQRVSDEPVALPRGTV